MNAAIKSNKSVLLFLNYLSIIPIYLTVVFGGLGFLLFFIAWIFQILVITIMDRRQFKEPENLAMLFVLIYSLQNVMIGLASNLNKDVSYFTVMLMISYTTIYIVVCVLSIFVSEDLPVLLLTKRRNKFLSFESAALIFICLVLLYSLRSSSSIFAKAGYIRNFSLFLLIYILGKKSVLNDTSIKKFINFICGLAVFLCIFGFIERFFLPKEFWLGPLNLWKVYEGKTLYSGGTMLPGMFHTDFLGFHFRRLASTFAEPVNASYFFAFASICAILNKRMILSIVAAVAMLLTFGKGGMLVFAVALIVVMLERAGRKMSISKLTGIVAASIMAVCFYGVLFKKSALIHIRGLYSIPNNLLHNPFGHGLGAGGNWGKIFEYRRWEGITSITGAESQLGVVAYQLGLPGVVLFLCFFILFLKYLIDNYYYFKNGNNSTMARYNIFAMGMLTGILCASIFQENTFGPQASGVYFIFLGMVVRLNILSRKV